MGKKPAKPTEKKPPKTSNAVLEALKKEAEGPKAESDGSVKFLAREVKNIYTSEETLLDKDGKVSEDAMAVLVEITKNANLFVFVVKTARQRADLRALKPEIRDSARSALEKYVRENKLSVQFIPVPIEANPVSMKVKYLASMIDSATFPIWIIEKKGATADKDVMLLLKRTSSWSLVQDTPGSTSKDGTMVKIFGISTADDWKKFVEPADKDDVREVTAEKEKEGETSEAS